MNPITIERQNHNIIIDSQTKTQQTYKETNRYDKENRYVLESLEIGK